MLKPPMRKMLHLLPASIRSRIKFYWAHHFLPDLRNPKRFSEWLHHRKMVDRDPRFAAFSDKVGAKALVAAMIGERYITPMLYHGPDLPARIQRDWQVPFVVKGSFGCGMNYFVRSSSDLKWPEIERHISDWRASNFHDYVCEFWYDKIEPQILIEPFIGQSDLLPVDYKFFVFGGQIAFAYAVSGRGTSKFAQDYFTADWTPMDCSEGVPRSPIPPGPPKHLEDMLRIARILGKDFDFVRVDLYEGPEGPLFGEMTFSPLGGYCRMLPDSLDRELGDLWHDARLHLSGQASLDP